MRPCLTCSRSCPDSSLRCPLLAQQRMGPAWPGPPSLPALQAARAPDSTAVSVYPAGQGWPGGHPLPVTLRCLMFEARGAAGGSPGGGAGHVLGLELPALQGSQWHPARGGHPGQGPPAGRVRQPGQGQGQPALQVRCAPVGHIPGKPDCLLTSATDAVDSLGAEPPRVGAGRIPTAFLACCVHSAVWHSVCSELAASPQAEQLCQMMCA